MALDAAQLRIEGVYEQRQPGTFMFRVKVPTGVISAEQAVKVADVAGRFAGGRVHLTTRNSIEFHGVHEKDLAMAVRMLAAVGLTTRGACGGAVRGIVCSTPFSAHFPTVQVLGRKLHAHFTQNPHFEGLPKKFKIAVNADYSDLRYLIQDVGLVYVGSEDTMPFYDLWTAGGLGKEPTPGFLMEERVSEDRVIPLVESIIRIYRERTPKGKRLKHLVGELGRDEFVRLVHERVNGAPSLHLQDGFDKQLTASELGKGGLYLEAGVFAGELDGTALRGLADIAKRHADGFMVLTSTQNVAFLVRDEAARVEARRALEEVGFPGTVKEERVIFRICPGNHECRMGLSPTRDVASEVLRAMGPAGERLSWSISGCGNSCSQPQLAGAGIVTAKLARGEDGERQPLFDLYRHEKDGEFSVRVRQEMNLEELLQAVGEMG
jgi:sulfite reductase beta subunit-like hemoprotein